MSVKITQFTAENVKRIKALTLTPSPTGLTVIGGRNNQGKTSSLDAIIWALGGDRYRPSQAQRDGSVLPPRLRLELSNGIIVERSGKNSDLKVIDAHGRRAGQQLLNSFVEQLALDMPRFMQSSSREKASTLLQIIGVEEQLTALERKEKELYDRRHAIGRIAEQKELYARELPSYPDAPSEPVSALELIQRQQDILPATARTSASESGPPNWSVKSRSCGGSWMSSRKNMPLSAGTARSRRSPRWTWWTRRQTNWRTASGILRSSIPECAQIRTRPVLRKRPKATAANTWA